MKILPNIPGAVKIYAALRYLNKEKKNIAAAKAAENYEKERVHIQAAEYIWANKIMEAFDVELVVHGEENLPKEDDRNELTTNANTGSDTDSYGSMTRTLGEQTHTMSAKTDTNDHSVTSYNSSSLTPDSRDTMTEGQHTVTDGQRQDTDGQHSDTHTKGTTLTTTSRVHGNVGVTTNQQMIDAELKLRKTSMIEIFLRDIDDFLCLKVYE